MIKFKDTEPRTTQRSRNITIDGVYIEDGRLVDEDGDIVKPLADALPDGVEEFTIKIKIGLEEDS